MPKKIDPTQRKTEIVEAAFRLIYKIGFEKTTLREIAKEANLSLSSVQYFFPLQKNIYLYAMDVILYRYEQRMQRASAAGAEDVESAVRMMKQMVQVRTEEERMENNIWIKFSTMATMNEDYKEKKDTFHEINADYASFILTKLQTQGWVKKSTDVTAESQSLVIFLHGLIFESVIYPALYNEEIVEKEIRQYLKKVCTLNH